MSHHSPLYPGSGQLNIQILQAACTQTLRASWRVLPCKMRPDKEKNNGFRQNKGGKGGGV